MEVSGRNQDHHKENLKAWELLQNPFKVKNSLTLHAYLQELGVFDPKDLLYCKDEWLDKISTFLKIHPQLEFNRYMGRHSQAGNFSNLGSPDPQPQPSQEPARLPPSRELKKVILEILNAFVIFTTALTRAFNCYCLLSVLF
jgi:hypothetical protein